MASSTNSWNSSRAGVYTCSGDCYLLRDLECLLPTIAELLAHRHGWRGSGLFDPAMGHAYARIEYTAHVPAPRSHALYVVGVQSFSEPGFEAAPHDHRFPFACLPLDPGGFLDKPLYEMPWEQRVSTGTVAKGVLVMRAGNPYAIEHPQLVWHAVRSLAPHCSVVLADVTRPAHRASRLRETRLDRHDLDRLREAASFALSTLCRERGNGRAQDHGPIPAQIV